MGQAQINVRTRACSGTFIARTKQAALTHNVRGKELKSYTVCANTTILTIDYPTIMDGLDSKLEKGGCNVMDHTSA